LLLSGSTAADDAAFSGIKVHACDGHAGLLKLFASTHLLAEEHVPCAVVLEDSDLQLLAPATDGAYTHTHERALAFGALPRVALLTGW